MPFAAPMIGKIPRRVLDHAHPNARKISSSPICCACDASVFGGFDGCPVGCAEGDVGHVHSSSLYQKNSTKPRNLRLPNQLQIEILTQICSKPKRARKIIRIVIT
jgi:hypothetical protein